MRGTCCLVSGSTRDPAAKLSPRLEAKIADAGRLREPPAACIGRVLTPEEELAIDIEADRREAESAKAAAARQLIDGPAALRDHDLETFCIAYGEAIRDGYLYPLWPHPSAASWARAEAKRRRLTFNDARISAGTVRLGDTGCSMLAAKGAPPRRQPHHDPRRRAHPARLRAHLHLHPQRHRHRHSGLSRE